MTPSSTRRGLFRLLAGVVVASSMEIMGFRDQFPKLILNPAWVNAPYEEIIIFHKDISVSSYKGRMMWKNPAPQTGAGFRHCEVRRYGNRVNMMGGFCWESPDEGNPIPKYILSSGQAPDEAC